MSDGEDSPLQSLSQSTTSSPASVCSSAGPIGSEPAPEAGHLSPAQSLSGRVSDVPGRRHSPGGSAGLLQDVGSVVEGRREGEGEAEGEAGSGTTAHPVSPAPDEMWYLPR